MSLDAETILAGCGFFAAVDGDSRRRLLAMAVRRRYPRQTMIFRQGDPCPGVFVVGSGLVRVYKSSPAGKEQVLHLVPPGGTFAEVAAIGGFDCPAFAETLEDSDCLLLPAADFAKALGEDHQLCLELMGSMAMWVKRLVTLVEDISLRDAAGRVARYLLQAADQHSGQVQLPSLKRHLASQLNLTSETLSRTLRRLDELGLIQTGNDGLNVIDRDGLQLAADGEFPQM